MTDYSADANPDVIYCTLVSIQWIKKHCFSDAQAASVRFKFM